MGSTSTYWISPTESNWNNTSNWSLSSGGPSACVVPGAESIAVFDSSGLGNCNLDATANIYGFDMSSGYTGKFMQNSYTMDVDSSGMLLSDGTFDSTAGTITVRGPFYLTGTQFTAPSGSLRVQGDFYYDGTSGFAHNDGTAIIWTSPGNILTGNDIRFYDLRFRNDSDLTRSTTLVGDIYTEQSLKMISGYFSGDGTVHVLGDAAFYSYFGQIGSDNTALVLVDGSGYQYIENYQGAIWPSLSIDKTTAGDVKITQEGPVLINGDLSVVDGTFNMNEINVYVGASSGLSFTRSETTVLPVIIEDPLSQTIIEGDSVTFSVESL